MTLLIDCEMCNVRLDAPGGLLFGVPDPFGRVDKTHLCGDCYDIVINFVIDWNH